MWNHRESRLPAVFIVATLAVSVPASNQEPGSGDRAALEALERQWLASEHDRSILQQILADDFLHPVAAGVVLTQTQHIEWRSTIQHQPAANISIKCGSASTTTLAS
jgi:hypothetical protein